MCCLLVSPVLKMSFYSYSLVSHGGEEPDRDRSFPSVCFTNVEQSA